MVAGMIRRRWLLAFLLILAVLILAGCTGGGGSTVVDNAIAWISGLVTKSRGEPIPSATVTLTETGQNTTTDSQGRFSLGTTHRGTGTLRAEAGEYLTLQWPVSITSSGITDLRLRLVTMADYNDTLFRQLTGATDTGGTWRWDLPTVTYYIDRSGAYRPEFDAPLYEAFTQWSMLSRRAVTFVEDGPGSAIQISFVSSKPCGFANAAGCAGVTAVTAEGGIRGALIELHAGYATDVGLAIHEVGHTLAFTGHSPTLTDLMYDTMNGATSPSNAEAAVAAVLYSNPPGATMATMQLPAAQQPAAALLAPAVLMGGVAPARVLEPVAIQTARAPIQFNALEGIAAMVRSWFAGSGCLINLPLFCDTPGFRIW